MLVFCVSVWILVNVVFGQQQENCQCTVYFECQDVVSSDETKCAEPYYVCCKIPTGPNITSVTSPVIATTKEPVKSTPDSEDRQCGKRGDNSWVKIFGDDVETFYGEFPWMVSVMKTYPSGKTRALCGGSIIHPNIVLTAAHSVSGFSASSLLVKAGAWDLEDPDEVSKQQDRSVSQIHIQPGYNGRFKKIANDLAILELSEPFTINDDVATVCLPSSDVQLNTSACVATGWGKDNSGSNTTINLLKKVDLPVVEFNSCQDQLRKIKNVGSSFSLHNSFICAGGGKADTCKGDGGGPLVCQILDDPNYYTQVGVTSWGVDCGTGPPGVYASVQSAAAWIEETIKGYR